MAGFGGVLCKEALCEGESEREDDSLTVWYVMIHD